MKKEEILCFHLLNDYSGSPQVLLTVAKSFVKMGYNVRINTSKTSGVLLKEDAIQIHYSFYRWVNFKPLQLLIFIFTQIQLFFFTLFNARRCNVIYVNTILPFGAALAGALLRKRIIYHIHEKYLNPNILQKIAICVMERTATDMIFVSNYLKEEYKDFGTTKKYIVYNVLPLSFTKEADRYDRGKIKQKEDIPTILMLSSLKKYKGIKVFANLAKEMPQYEFCLVANASKEDVYSFKKENNYSNFFIYSAQSNVHPFYQKSHLLVNLSFPNQWIETFGLTILEGMRYGLPIIAPPVGGPIELVRDGENGFLISSENFDNLKKGISTILENKERYFQYSSASISLAKEFDYNVMYKKIETIIKGEK